MTLRSPKHFKGIFTPYPGDTPLIMRSRKWLQSYISNYIPSMISPEGSFLFNGFKSFPGGSVGKRVILQCRRPGFDSWVGKILWRRAWQPTPVFLPGESHGQRSLMGYSPWGLARVRHNLETKPLSPPKLSVQIIFPHILNTDLTCINWSCHHGILIHFINL